MDADEVIQRLFEDNYGLSENESSDEEGEGIFAYAGQQHLDSVELATLSSGMEVSMVSLQEPIWMFLVRYSYRNNRIVAY